MNMTAPRALIAEDEPLLADALRRELALAWPELHIAASVGDGLGAVREALALRPDVLLLDIRMPGQSGLEAAAELADAWPEDGPPFPALVFITAYDQYAVQAFEAQAVDYLLKPVQPQRLQRTVHKLRATLARRAPAALALEAAVARLRELLAVPGLAAPPAAPRLVVLRASGSGHDGQIHLVPVADVLYFEAADKYVRVLTAEREYLLRTPLKELAQQLDPVLFWPVHRGTLVRAAAIASVTRDAAGRPLLHLRQRPERLAVSRMYAHQFRAM
ncbi:LytTR family DNA-binding domain-containing protein [Ramlibacter sp. H39-3-26]|uniref:LytR/AlgR family response regulator transcription factor n=1 Tax=Curvibacter soli TaxID=3031331 RepID=UPI0023DADEF2|nr:LytTR family DNA-binding domain-containing protein [Ramlibacter sp. H39-3-26]MDF1485536.1 LytTR family DNA-binding domain-containing protein [Ramlibacter sp. H39-3-26]